MEKKTNELKLFISTSPSDWEETAYLSLVPADLIQLILIYLYHLGSIANKLLKCKSAALLGLSGLLAKGPPHLPYGSPNTPQQKLTSGQSYKCSTTIINVSRVVNICNLVLVSTTLESWRLYKIGHCIFVCTKMVL